MYGPFGSPVFSRRMFQQQNIMDPGFMRMLQIRDAMRKGQPAMMEGRTDMGTPLEALPGDEGFGQLGEAQPIQATDEMRAQLSPQQGSAELQQVSQAKTTWITWVDARESTTSITFKRANDSRT